MTAADRPEVTQEVLARAEAAYLGLALGDALGATVEFMTPREIVHDYGTHCEIIGGGWLKLRAGQVTDDTGMTMALAEAILLSGGRVQALTTTSPACQGLLQPSKTVPTFCRILKLAFLPSAYVVLRSVGSAEGVARLYFFIPSP